ncbi:MAG: DUF2271 domain-containing protein, partial [Marinagarivorans sp.]|nr:DUF2271 domain-containing protein [Marinagarivorans sp.]
MRQAIVLAAALLALPAAASDLKVTVEIPRLEVAEYHRPYVAVWIEDESNAVAANLAVWYDTEMKENKGQEWLKDMRQWWRRTGRSLSFPIDGITSATRAVGEHSLVFSQGKDPLGDLAKGNYTLVVEAAREVGGRELLKVPFEWPPSSATTLNAKG